MKKFRLSDIVITLMIGIIVGSIGMYVGHKRNQNYTMNKISSIESSGDPNAISPAGARGQYQIMRGTWDECTTMMGVNWDFDTEWDNPKKNKAVGEFYYFKRIPAMLKAYKIPDTTETRLACYNGGIGRVKNAYRNDPENWKAHLPKETRDYIIKFAKVK